MKRLITNIIDYININSARFFFYNSNLFTYNLFSKYYKKNLANKKCNNEILENSYGKIGVASKKEIDEINKELIDQIKILEIKDDKRIIFKFNDNIKESIKNIINQDLKDFLTNLENFYNVRICLGNSVISRNFHIHNSLDVYSNFYHNDRYTFNYFKIFINLHDVSNQEGPMHIVKKKHSQEFFKKSS